MMLNFLTQPSNVLVTLHDVVAVPKVIDFGIAKALGQQLTDSTLHTGFAQLVGTPLYMSPEQAAGERELDGRSDEYALGCVLYEMCNLRHAFDAQSINGLAVKLLRGSFPPLNQMYSNQLRDLIGKMLSIKPSYRPTIVDILNKSFVRKRVISYINECLVESQGLSPTDFDDMFADGLRE